MAWSRADERRVTFPTVTTDDAARGTKFLDFPDHPSGATELTRQLRRVRGLVAGCVFDDVHEEAEVVRLLADRLEAAGTRVDPADYESWGSLDHIASNPVTGNRNPVAPPLDSVVFPDGLVRADLTLGAEYQGPPGCVHGGVVALIFDELLGLANAASKTIGMTVELRLSYKSPTPLDTPLRFEAKQDRMDGRKIWASGTVTAGDTVCAVAEGLFVVPKVIADAADDWPAER